LIAETSKRVNKTLFKAISLPKAEKKKAEYKRIVPQVNVKQFVGGQASLWEAQRLHEEERI
jgi:hypothetical protein